MVLSSVRANSVALDERSTNFEEESYIASMRPRANTMVHASPGDRDETP